MKKFRISSIFPIHKKETVKSDILIKGKNVVFIACSIVSSCVNLIFISNLTKSPYTIGTLLSIPAALFLGIMSIALDLSKALHVIQVNTLNELYRFVQHESWSKRIKNVARKWNSIYILYVVLSIITSVSLSSISIGAGITRNSDTLRLIDEYTTTGKTYSNIDNAAKTITRNNLISKATDTTESDAIQYANEKMNTIRPLIETYKADRSSFEALGVDVSSTEEVDFNGEKIIPSKYWDQRNNEINIQLQNAGYGKVSGQQIKNLNIVNVQSVIKNNYLSLSKTSIDANITKLNELTDSTMEEARSWIISLNSLGLKDPTTGLPIVFDTDETKSTKVLVESAKAKLSSLRVAYENDSGDIGTSSKIFMQLGSAIDNAKNNNSGDLKDATKTEASSFGTTEVLMMLMLLFLSLLCELAINQFSPKANITRRMLSQFSQYFPEDFDVNKFMMKMAYEERDYDIIDDAEFKKQLAYCKDRIALKNTYENAINEVNEPKPAKVAKPAAKVELPKVELTSSEDIEKKITAAIATEKSAAKKVVKHAKTGKKFVKISEENAEKLANPFEDVKAIEVKEPIEMPVREEMIEVPTVIEEKPVEEVVTPVEVEQPKVEPVNVEEQKAVEEPKLIEPAVVQKPTTLPYRLGRTTERVKNRFVDYVHALYKNFTVSDGIYNLNPADVAAKAINLSQKDFDIIENRLLDMVYGKDGKHILYKENGVLKSPFDETFFISWITKVV